jgi:hypothetical protein
VYDIGYSARSASQGSEAMFFCEGLVVPPFRRPSYCDGKSRRESATNRLDSAEKTSFLIKPQRSC